MTTATAQDCYRLTPRAANLWASGRRPDLFLNPPSSTRSNPEIRLTVHFKGQALERSINFPKDTPLRKILACRNVMISCLGRGWIRCHLDWFRLCARLRKYASDAL